VLTIAISLLQILCFVTQDDDVQLETSTMIYCPGHKKEFWRLVTYMLVHSSWIHLIFNLIVQLVVGIPLELAHGPFSTALIYLAGVLYGSLSVSLFNPTVCLVGASSGIYAILAAHLSNVLLNWRHLDFVAMRIIGVIVIAVVGNCGISGDSCKWLLDASEQLPISRLAHLSGAFAGFTVGVFAVEEYNPTPQLQFFRWMAFIFFLVILSIQIVFTYWGNEGI
jgi:rhomboid-related protein 1/2/3